MKNLKKILNEKINQIKEHRGIYKNNEQAVRTQLIDPVLNEIGWIVSNPKYVKPNERMANNKIPDYTLEKNNKVILYVEAKNLSIDLRDKKIIKQLADYCYDYGVEFGVLTNGIEWLLFKTFEQNADDRIIWQVNLEKNNIEVVADALLSIAYDKIDDLSNSLNQGKVLEEGWKELIKNEGWIVKIISKELLKKIKVEKKNFKIKQEHLNDFTKSHLNDEFEKNKIEEENEEIEEENVIPKNTKELIENAIFKRKKPMKKLSVTFPNDKKIFKTKVVDTFVETLKEIGFDKIIDLEINEAGKPLVSKTKNKNGAQRNSGKYWITTNSSTDRKLYLLEKINKELDLNLKIESIVNETYTPNLF